MSKTGQKQRSASMTRWTLDAGMIGASGGTSNAGKRRLPRFAGGAGGANPRASFDNTLPKRSPDKPATCMAAA
jgi:hypothetical protein